VRVVAALLVERYGAAGVTMPEWLEEIRAE
jgi:hypothetical protein